MDWATFWSLMGSHKGAELLTLVILFGAGAVAGRITIALIKKRWPGKR